MIFFYFGLSLSCNSHNRGEYRLEQEPMSEVAEWVTAADLDGDGNDELLIFNDGVLELQQSNQRKIQIDSAPKIAIKHRQGNREIIYLASGTSREFPDAELQIWKIDSTSEEVLWSSPKSQIGDLQMGNKGLYLVYSSGQKLRGGWLTENGFQQVLEERLALRQIPFGDNKIIVGRVYGEEKRSDGDLRIYDTNSSDFKKLYSLRGIRALAKSDLNRDGQDELLVSDGWHFKYAQEAKARVVLYEGLADSFPRTIATFDNEYTVERIEAHSKLPLVLVRAPKFGYLIKLDDLGWKSEQLAKVGDKGNVVFVNEGSTVHIVASGDPMTKYTLKRVSSNP